MVGSGGLIEAARRFYFALYTQSTSLSDFRPKAAQINPTDKRRINRHTRRLFGESL
jgi:hypothetical protein